MNCYSYYTKLKFVDPHSHFTSFGVKITISLVLIVFKAKVVAFSDGYQFILVTVGINIQRVTRKLLSELLGF